MKLSYEGNNVSDCFYMALRDHKNYARAEQIRSTTRHEILDYTITLGDPLQNILFVPFRYNNIPAIIAETLWVFSGRIDMFFLRYYLKNAIRYSDNGEVWRGGYGKRLVGYDTRDDDGCYQRINQIDRVITYLKKDRFTSRGILNIPDGSDYQMNEEGEEKKDEPCTIFVQYCQRGCDLHCFVRMRSNDLVLGCFNVNLFEWTFLQQLIANEIGAVPGPYHINAVSMHIYANWMKKVPLLLQGQTPVDIYSIIEPVRLSLKWSQFKKQINELLFLELAGRNFGTDPDLIAEIATMFHPDLIDMFLCMAVTTAIKKRDNAMLAHTIESMKNDVYKLGCLEYLTRRLGSNHRGYVTHLFNKTMRDKYKEFEKELLAYILHSHTEQEVMEELNRYQ